MSKIDAELYVFSRISGNATRKTCTIDKRDLGTSPLLFPLYSYGTREYPLLHEAGLKLPASVTVTIDPKKTVEQCYYDAADAYVRDAFPGYSLARTVTTTSYWNGTYWITPKKKGYRAFGFSIRKGATRVERPIEARNVTAKVQLLADFVALIQDL